VFGLLIAVDISVLLRYSSMLSLYRISALRHPRRCNGEGEEEKVKGGRIEHMNDLQEWRGGESQTGGSRS
jgi:hypothetical protein